MNQKSFALGCLLLLALLVPLASRTAQNEDRAKINGKIVDRATSAPLSAELGLAIHTAKGIVLKHARANERGEFEFTDLPAGEFHLSTKHDDYAVAHAAFSLLSDEIRSVDLRLVKARRVSGIVMDVRRNPLAETRVQVLYEREDGFTNRFQWEDGDVRTDAEGRFTVEVAPERPYALLATRDGFASAASVFAQTNESDLVLTLAGSVTFSGKITDELGQPLRGAQVELTNEHEQTALAKFLPFEMLLQNRQVAVTKADGTFYFTNVSPAEHALVVRHSQAEPQRLMVNMARKDAVVVRLNRAALPLRKDRRQQ